MLFRSGDLATSRDVAKSREVFEEVVGQFVARRLPDDALELLRLYEAILVLVEMDERLPNALTLQTAKHLGKLRVGHDVPLVLGADVERCPFGRPIERQAVLALVCLPYLVEVVKVDVTCPLAVEEAEDDFVLGIGFGEEVLEDGPVLQIDATFGVAVGNRKQDTVLVALDLVLESERVSSYSATRARFTEREKENNSHSLRLPAQQRQRTHSLLNSSFRHRPFARA